MDKAEKCKGCGVDVGLNDDGRCGPCRVEGPFPRIAETYGSKAARAVAGLVSGAIDPESYDSVDTWVRQCYSRPCDDELIMCAINEVLGTYGVEAIRSEGAWVDSFHGDIVGTYCNTGDTYALTIVLDSESGEYIETSWGDFYESVEEAQEA